MGSYWLYEAERRDIRYDDYQKKGMPPQVCPLSLFDQVVTADRRLLARGGNAANGGATVVVSGAENVDGNQKFSVANFALPFLFLFFCVAIATMVHLASTEEKQKKMKKCFSSNFVKKSSNLETSNHRNSIEIETSSVEDSNTSNGKE